MRWSFLFFLNSVLFGAGLAMDAFSVSLANGLHEPRMSRRRMALIAGTFASFQTAMPLAGWFCVRTVASFFSSLQRFIPWIAFLLLLWIGGKMLLEGLRGQSASEAEGVGSGELLMQGVATSIDALSVGFAIEAYPFPMALAESVIIGSVTFLICAGGLLLGRRFGTKLAGKASVLGGIILISIGLEILLSGITGG